MSVPFEAVPEGLTRQIKKVSAYRKNVAKVQINSAATANPTDTIEIQLPTKGIIDFNDLIFQATCTITNGTGTALHSLPEPEEFFRRVTLECDGATIVDIDYYNDIFCIYKNATCSTIHSRMRSCYSNDAFGLKKKLDVATITGLTIPQYQELTENVARIVPTDVNAGYIIRDVYENIAAAATPQLNACVFLGIQDLGYIDASIFPSMRLKLQLANNNILGASAGVVSYALSSMTLLVPQIILPAYTNSLLQLLAPDQNGNSETLYYKFRRYLPYIFASNTANLNSLKFSLSTSSLDRLWLTLKPPGFGTQAPVTPGDCINYFKMSANDSSVPTATIQYVTVNIDNEAIDGGVRDDLIRNGFARNLQELGVLTNTQYDNLVDSNILQVPADAGGGAGNFRYVHNRSEFKRYKWFYVKSLKYEGDNTAMSGYNCMGSLANIQLDIEFNGVPSAGCTFIAIAECSALLAVSAGRQVSVIL